MFDHLMPINGVVDGNPLLVPPNRSYSVSRIQRFYNGEYHAYLSGPGYGGKPFGRGYVCVKLGDVIPYIKCPWYVRMSAWALLAVGSVIKTPLD